MFEDESPEEKLLSAIRGAQGASRQKGFARMRSVAEGLYAKSLAVADRVTVAIAAVILIGACGSVVRAVRTNMAPPVAVKAPEVKPAPESMGLAAYQKGVRAYDLFGVVPVSTSAPQEQPDLKGLQLQGVITADPRQAILKDGKTDATVFVAVGDLYGGYTVKTIDDNKVTMVKGEETFELKM